MKNKSRLLFLTCGLIWTIYFGCSKDLDSRPLGQLDEAALQNKSGVEGLLIGAYSLLDGFGNYYFPEYSQWSSAASNWIYGGVCGTEGHKGSEKDDQLEIQALEKFTMIANSPYLQGKWAAVYDGIQRCNDVIRIMRKVPSLKAEDTIEFRAEALFLRGHYHFEAKKMWNKVPFVDETITYGAGNYKMGNEEDIWPRIEEDLLYAVANLPLSQNEIGRANHYMAAALLAKAYLFQHKFKEAKILLDEIISSGNYGLDKYSDNFNPELQNRREYVFAAQSSVNDGSFGNNSNAGDVLNAPYGSSSFCCGFFQPTQWLVNHFKTDPHTGLPDLDHFNDVDVNNDYGIKSSEPFTPYAGTIDPRLDLTVGRRGIPYLDWGVHPGYDWIREQSSGGPYSSIKSSPRKSQASTYTDNSGWFPLSMTAINTNLIRYADILLWAAEAEVESGNADALEKARGYVNEIRDRAADPSGWVYKYIDDQDPSLGFSNIRAANYFIKPYTDPWTDPVFALKAIRYERMLELGMEGHRFFDLVRWGIASQEINEYLIKEKNITSYLQGVVFIAGKNEYFPIPQSEIDKTDHHLQQNPYY